MVAEDHIQDLFLRIWKKRANLGDVTGVKTYLWTALRRSLIDQIHKESRRSDIYTEFGEETSSMQFAVDEIIIQREKDRAKRAALKKAMDELTPRQREIIYLRYYEGMTYEEIESITSLNYQTLRNYVCKSLKILDGVINSPANGILLTTLAPFPLISLICCVSHVLMMVH